MWYPACPTQVDGASGKRSCNKKLIDQGGMWTCNNCGGVEGPVFRYILSATLQDTSGSAYATLFDAEGAQLLGKTANEMQQLAAVGGGSGSNPPEFDSVIKGALFSCVDGDSSGGGGFWGRDQIRGRAGSRRGRQP
jgi:hypothetical protein